MEPITREEFHLWKRTRVSQKLMLDVSALMRVYEEEILSGSVVHKDGMERRLSFMFGIREALKGILDFNPVEEVEDESNR